MNSDSVDETQCLDPGAVKGREFMMEEPSLWSVIRSAEVEGVTDEDVCRCFLGKVLGVREYRNAWDNQIINDFQGAIHPSKHAATFWVACRRRAGSSWIIVELPAIVAVGQTYAGIITDIVGIAGEQPFSHWNPVTVGKMTIFAILKSLRSACSGSGVMIISGKEDVQPAQLPFYFWRSQSLGGDFPLSWSAITHTVDLTQAFDIVKRVTQRIQEAKVD